MGERISYGLKRLIRERKVVKIKTDMKLVLKELEGAKSDLKQAMR